MNKYLIAISVICFISGCKFNKTNKTCRDEQTVTSRYKNGRVRIMTIVNCTDTNLKTTITFYSNGDTDEINSRKNGKLDGIVKDFNNKGELDRIAFFKDNKMDSAWKLFDNTGRKMLLEYSTEYPFQFALLEFDSNGILKCYSYTANEKVRMALFYLPSGEIDTVIGNYLTGFKSNKVPYKTAYNVGDSLRFCFFLAKPPNDSVRFSAALYNLDDKESPQLNELPIVNSKATLSSKIGKRGNYSIKYEVVAIHKKSLAKPIRAQASIRLTVK